MVRERVVEGMVVAYLYNIIYFASLSIDNNVEIYESQLSQMPLSNQAALLFFLTVWVFYDGYYH